MSERFETQPNGDFWRVIEDAAGNERARFYVAARNERQENGQIVVRDHQGQVIETKPLPAATVKATVRRALEDAIVVAQQWEWLATAAPLNTALRTEADRLKAIAVDLAGQWSRA